MSTPFVADQRYPTANDALFNSSVCSFTAELKQEEGLNEEFEIAFHMTGVEQYLEYNQ